DDNKYIVQIYIEGYERVEGVGSLVYKPMLVGLSAIDVSTGESNTYEVMNYPHDVDYAIDEICRYIQTHQPKELYIVTKKLEMKNEEIETMLGLYSCNYIYNIRNDDIEKEYFDRNYQREVLKKIFPNTKDLTPVEYANLSNMES